jgi:phosphatidylinositol glycan class N
MAENGSEKYDTHAQISRTRYSVAKLLVLGLIFHVVYLRSVFDCYFTSPVVNGMKNYGTVSSGGKAPAKRLVLIVGESFPQIATTHLLTMD